MEEWKNGRMEEWKNGMMEEWNDGRLEEWNPDSYRGEKWRIGMGKNLTGHEDLVRFNQFCLPTDCDYFSNQNAEDVFDAFYNLMHSANPFKYPKIF
jgi:hypothetical protein